MSRLIVIMALAVGASPALAQTGDASTTADTGSADDGAQVAQADEDGAEAAGEEVTLSADEGDAEGEVSLEELEEDEGTLIAPFSVSASVNNRVGMGVIAGRDSNTVTNSYLMSFGFNLGYQTPHDPLSMGLGFSASKFLTEFGGSTRQREARFGDIGFSLSYAPIWSDPDFSGLSLSGSLGMTIPTSESSRFSNLRTSLAPSLSLSRSFGDLSLRLGVSGSKSFHRDTTIVADTEDFLIDALARDGGSELIGADQIALDTGVLTEWTQSTSFSVGYSWFTGFNTSISFSFSNFWTYDNGTISSGDEFTSENAQAGRGHGQSMTGSFGASYAFLDHFSASLRFSTSQQPLTADQQRVRFPFWDLETGNLQNTSMSFGLSASY